MFSALILGQVLSLLNACSQVCSELLNRNFNIDLTALQPIIAYLGIFLTSAPFFIYFHLFGSQTDDDKKIITEQPTHVDHVYELFSFKRDDVLKHCLAACLDCTATFCIVYSFRFISIFYVVLLLSLTTPFSMIFSSRILYKRSFSILQVAGVFISLISVMLFMIFSLHDPNLKREMWVGLLLGFISAIFYSLSNISQEWLIKRNGIIPFLFFLGLFGSFVSLILAILFEYQHFASGLRLLLCGGSSTETVALAGFGSSLVLFYLINPLFLKSFGATTFNLSLLSSIIYSSAAGLLLSPSTSIFGSTYLFVLYYGATLFAVVLGQYCYIRGEYACKEKE